MDRINQLFSNKKHDILSIYFCAGAPKADNTAEVITSLEKNGVDIIEIGIPFSDPLADGPVIQDASCRALRNGMTLTGLFAQLEGIRNTVSIPLILMGYLNPIMQYGMEQFFRSCSSTGIDGAIIPDLPFDEYMQSVKPIAEKYGIKVIMLITPETSEERIRLIDDNTEGFIYMVSSAAVTGAQKDFDARKQEYFKRIEGMNLRNPRMIGFGISNRRTYEAAASHAAGCIIGSRFVTLLNEESGNAERAIERLKMNLEIQ
ncbi:tryptophan synthase subunit alpha [uncultured Bacteroides sp.]|uniref:tryptophan synthase subunit alpha n=1 Tax=uncultured Bacteroides sp. TaxID=162156 RepID=UPI0026281CF6|nr:tryptophan synthase subunit alpha [uncultured Bacteroides sp.]